MSTWDSPTDEPTRERVRRTQVSLAGLHPVGRRLPLGAYLRELARYRAFIAFEARSRLLTANRGMILGNAWLVGRPLIDGATYFLFFGVILQASRGVANYPGFLIIGVFLFAFTASSMRAGLGAMTGGRNLLRAFAFPRAVVPLSMALRETLNQIPALVSMAVMLIVLPPHALPRWSWLLVPGVVVLATLFNSGLVLFLARLTSHVPDLSVVIGMITRLLVYGSGVMFSLDRFITHPQWLAVLTLNPVYVILDLARQLLLDGIIPPVHQWALLGVWAVGSLVVGFVYFWAGEEGYGRD